MQKKEEAHISQDTYGSMSRWSFLFFEKLFLGTELQQRKNKTLSKVRFTLHWPEYDIYFIFINMVFISNSCL